MTKHVEMSLDFMELTPLEFEQPLDIDSLEQQCPPKQQLAHAELRQQNSAALSQMCPEIVARSPA
jgi:hypothetical protein